MMFLGPLLVPSPFPPSFRFPLPAFRSPPPSFRLPLLLFRLPPTSFRCPPSFHSCHPIILMIHPASKELAGMGWVVLAGETVPLLCLLVSHHLVHPVVPVLHPFPPCEQLLVAVVLGAEVMVVLLLWLLPSPCHPSLLLLALSLSLSSSSSSLPSSHCPHCPLVVLVPVVIISSRSHPCCPLVVCSLSPLIFCPFSRIKVELYIVWVTQYVCLIGCAECCCATDEVAEQWSVENELVEECYLGVAE